MEYCAKNDNLFLLLLLVLMLEHRLVWASVLHLFSILLAEVCGGDASIQRPINKMENHHRAHLRTPATLSEHSHNFVFHIHTRFAWKIGKADHGEH